MRLCVDTRMILHLRAPTRRLARLRLEFDDGARYGVLLTAIVFVGVGATHDHLIVLVVRLDRVVYLSRIDAGFERLSLNEFQLAEAKFERLRIVYLDDFVIGALRELTLVRCVLRIRIDISDHSDFGCVVSVIAYFFFPFP